MSRKSKETSTLPSGVGQFDNGSTVGSSSTSRHGSRKRSLDGGRGERLSIFGGAFSGTLGKSRKPAPRYSSSVFLSAVVK